MVLYILFIIVLILYNVKFKINRNYLSLKQTTIVNGIFILLVFFRHVAQYVTFNSFIDYPMLLIDKYTGQLIVTMFLFNSGYGLMESVKTKKGYIKTIPKNRILTTWIGFSLCVCIYLLLNILIGNKILMSKFLLSLICIESIGNSNWYILAIIVMWLCSFISLKIFEKNFLKMNIFNFFLSITYIGLLYLMKAPNFYYNTILCYNLGIYYSCYKNTIENYIFCKRNYIPILIISILFFLTSALFVLKKPNSIIFYQTMSIFFVISVLMVLSRIELNSRFLFLLGKNLFGLYMLQRVPMILLKKIGIAQYNVYLYFIFCFILMIVLGISFNCFLNKCIKKRISDSK